MLVNFVKMHGLGNDFVVIDVITQKVRLHSAHIKRIADRHLGIGCDQVILIEPPISPEADFFYRIFNANGSEVEQCGNGARCAARFFYDFGFCLKKIIKADCLAGSITFTIENDDSIALTMGMPQIEPQTTISFEKEKILGQFVSLGNPHWVISTDNLINIPLKKWGTFLNKHEKFPQGINVECMQIVDKHRINVRVFERGVGETLACGSGAAAAVVSGIEQNLLESPVTVQFNQGTLTIIWEDKTAPIILRGPAITVFLGRFRL